MFFVRTSKNTGVSLPLWAMFILGPLILCGWLLFGLGWVLWQLLLLAGHGIDRMLHDRRIDIPLPPSPDTIDVVLPPPPVVAGSHKRW